MADFLFSGCSDNYEFIVNESELLVSVDIGSYWYFTGETDVSPFTYSGCVYLESSGTTIVGYPSYSGVSLTYYGNTDCQGCIDDNTPITPLAGDTFLYFSSCCDTTVFTVNILDLIGLTPVVGSVYNLSGKTDTGGNYSGCTEIFNSGTTDGGYKTYLNVELLNSFDSCANCLLSFPCAETPTPTPTNTQTPTPTNTQTPTPTNTQTPTPTNTQTPTPTNTQTPTPTNTQTPTSSLTPTPTVSPTQLECNCYEVISETVFYIDCFGVLTGFTIFSPPAYVCSSVIPTGDTVTLVGPCIANECPSSPTPTPTETPTPTPTVSPTQLECNCYEVSIAKDDTFNYIDCFGVPQSQFGPTGSVWYVCSSTVPTGLFITANLTGLCVGGVCPTPTPTPTVSSSSSPSINCPINEYCINLNNTPYSGYSDIYINTNLIYNGYNYFTGQTTGYFIYYSLTSLSWCLSETLGGTCILFGQSPCLNTCPDLDESFMSQGICPTPTPTQTPACNIDFDILFNCDFIPTPSNTPTSTVTPTITPTPTQTILCPVDIDVEISEVSATPTPTPTPTPSFGPGGQCDVFGLVTYESLNGYIICDGNKNWFTDCETGDDYYTASPALFNGSVLTVLNVYSGVIDFGPYNETKCLIYKGIVQFDTFGPNITITNSHGTDCDSCSPVPPPSQTPTITPSITPTKTVTPTPSRSFSDVVYGKYFVIKNCYGGEYFVQPVLPALPNNIQLEVGESFGWSLYPIFNPGPSGYVESYTCWWYVGNYYGTINGFTPNGGPRWGGLIPFPVPLGVGVRTSNVDYFTTSVQNNGYPNAGFNPNSPFKGTGNNDQCDQCCAQLNTVCTTQFADP